MKERILQLFDIQKKNRWNVSKTTSHERIQKLKKLKKSILKFETEIAAAIYKDFRKPAEEVFLTEIGPTLEEINAAIKGLPQWMKPQKVKTPVALLGTRTEIRSEARGLCLILAPWNYPFQLLISPLVGAIAAGNCVILKPSEKVPETAKILSRLIAETFPENEVASVEGDASIAEELLKLPFDHIFFTGSTAIGKKVMQAASQTLASVTLELGGKSPAILTDQTDFQSAAERICWGKFVNAGQTCVAPDYVFVPEKHADHWLNLMRDQIGKVFGKTSEEQKNSKDFARIVDLKAFERLKNQFDQTMQMGAHLVTGGIFDSAERYISPTVIDRVPASSPLMKEEIFGPIMPVIRYQNLSEVFEWIRANDKPLALYLFTSSEEEIEVTLAETSAGGTAINNLLIHLANHHAPFGGVGASGQGSYHGMFGFQAFSHQRTVLIQGRWDLSRLIYPPYSHPRFQRVVKMIRRITS